MDTVSVLNDMIDVRDGWGSCSIFILGGEELLPLRLPHWIFILSGGGITTLKVASFNIYTGWGRNYYP